jgi:hypothetical protein
LTPIQKPLKGPQILKASIIYAEQVGVYRHEGGNNGEIVS